MNYWNDWENFKIKPLRLYLSVVYKVFLYKGFSKSYIRSPLLNLTALISMMKLGQFRYKLPEELIAQQPAKHRDESRLMVVHKRSGKIEHKMFKDDREKDRNLSLM